MNAVTVPAPERFLPDTCKCPECISRRDPYAACSETTYPGRRTCRLPLSDPRHPDMFSIDYKRGQLSVYWWDESDAYDFALSAIDTPVKLLGFLQLIGAANWPHATGARIGYLIEALTEHFDWPIGVFWD